MDEKTKVVVTDIRIPFGSMVTLILKFVIASIPAMIILFILGAVCVGFIQGFGPSFRSADSSSALTDSPRDLAKEAQDRGKIYANDQEIKQASDCGRLKNPDERSGCEQFVQEHQK